MAKNREPGIYLQLDKQHEDCFAAVEALGQTVRAAGPLDERTAHLVQPGAAAAIRSEGAVHSHVRRALEVGAGAEAAVRGTGAMPTLLAHQSGSAR